MDHTQHGKLVLIVDDMEINRQIIGRLAVRTGSAKHGAPGDTAIECHFAEDGAAALKRAAETAYDLILLDINLPDCSGVEVLHALRTEPAAFESADGSRNLCTPVIALTGDDSEGAKAHYLELGFTDYLEKPVIPEKLYAVLAKYLAGPSTPGRDERGPAESCNPGRNERDLTASSGREHDDQSDTHPLPDIPPALAGIPGLSPQTGIQYCGDTRGWEQSLRSFYRAIPRRAGEIRDCLTAEDADGISGKAHALKSTARAVGLTEICTLAAQLEADAGIPPEPDGSARKLKTPVLALVSELLHALDTIEAALAPCFDPPQANRPPLTAALLQDAASAILEFAAFYDEKNIRQVLDTLSSYDSQPLSESIQSAYKNLRQSAVLLHWRDMQTAAKNLIKEIAKQ